MTVNTHEVPARRAGARGGLAWLALPVLALLAGTLQAAPDGPPRGGGGGGGGAPSVMHAPGGPAKGPGGAPGYQPGPGRWWDGGHGHGHAYPVPGYGVRTLPPYSRSIIWGGVNYGYYGGVWYAPGRYGHVVVRPPIGIVVYDLPVWRTLVLIGGLGYYYANGAYYRERVEGGYEVVPPPVAPNGDATAAPARMFVYPRSAQSAEQQAGDEYECHRWATAQSGFDPTADATGRQGGMPGGRGDYQRARSACLEGRGYTVR